MAERRETGRDSRHDAALMERVCARDGAALEDLYDRYGRPAYALARRILGDESLAQDVVQDVFLAVWRDPGRFDERLGGFAPWLLAMTHHKAVDTVRREERLRAQRATQELTDVDGHHEEVADEVWSTLRGDRVRAALSTIPEAQRTSITLAYFGGYTQQEIAELTGTPLGTVKTRMQYGMRRLRTILDEGDEGVQTR